MIFLENVTGCAWSSFGNNRWPVIAAAAKRSWIKGLNSLDNKSFKQLSMIGRLSWLSTSARPCPGICFTIPETPPLSSPSTTALPSKPTVLGSLLRALSPITEWPRFSIKSITGAQFTLMPNSNTANLLSSLSWWLGASCCWRGF